MTLDMLITPLKQQRLFPYSHLLNLAMSNLAVANLEVVEVVAAGVTVAMIVQEGMMAEARTGVVLAVRVVAVGVEGIDILLLGSTTQNFPIFLASDIRIIVYLLLYGKTRYTDAHLAEPCSP